MNFLASTVIAALLLLIHQKFDRATVGGAEHSRSSHQIAACTHRGVNTLTPAEYVEDGADNNTF